MHVSHRAGWSRGSAALGAVMALLVASGNGAAYLLPVGGFSDGTDTRLVQFGPLDTEITGPSLRLPTNATITAASVVVSGEGGYLNQTTQETTTAEFSSSLLQDNVTVANGRISLGEASGVVSVTSSDLFANATLTNLSISGDNLTLTTPGQGGSFITQNLTAPEPDWGTFLAFAVAPGNSTLAFSVVDSNGTVIVANLVAGATVPINATQYPAIRLRGTLTPNTQWPFTPPSVNRMTLGTLSGETLIGAGVARSVSALYPAPGGGISSGPAATGFSKHSSNPVARVAASTFYNYDVKEPFVIKVGSQYWMYFSGADQNAVCGCRIGRAVSSDLVNWTFDSNVHINKGTLAWKSTGVGGAYVIPNPFATGYLMYFRGENSSGFTIGVANSTDGVNWTEYSGNPVLKPTASQWDSLYVFDPSRIVYNGTNLTMWYSGSSYASGFPFRSDLGVAFSSDGYNWTKYSANPVLSHGASFDSVEMRGGSQVLMNGLVHWYHTCNSGSRANICLSVSPDGFTNWTKVGRVLNSTASYDSYEVYMPAMVVRGNTLWMLYAGSDGSNAQVCLASTGAVAGQLTGTVDYGSGGPSRFVSLTIDASVPTGTQVNVQIRSSTDGLSWSGFEAFTGSSTTVLTPARRYLQWQVFLNGTSTDAAPTFRSLVLSSVGLVDAGRYESSAISSFATVAGLRIDLANSGTGGDLALYYSLNNGTNWTRIVPGLLYLPVVASNSLWYALELESSAGRAPVIDAVNITVQWMSLPENVTVRLGAAGTPFLNVSGVFDVGYNVTLSTSVLNGAIAAALAQNPSITFVDLPFVITSTRMGAVRLSEPRLVLSLKNPLSVSFAPSTTAVGVFENTTTPFSATHAVYPPQTKVNTTWSLDGSVASQSQDQTVFNFTTNFTSAGNYTITVEVENGDYSYNHTWQIVVYNVNRPPFFSFLSPSDPVSFSHTAQVNFSALASDPDNEPLSWVWRLDGVVQSSTASNMIAGPLTVGPHTLTATVSDPFESGTAMWSITSTNAAPQVLSQTPAALHSMSHAATDTFSVLAADADAEALSFRWELDGFPVPGLASFLSVGNRSVGTHTLRVYISDTYVTVNAAWTITSVNALPMILSRDPATDFNISHTASAMLSVNVADADFEPLTFEWRLDGVALPTGSGAQAAINSLSVGIHTVLLTVRDAYGSNSTAWFVTSTNAAPVLSGAFPPGAASASHSSSLDFAAAFTDDDGDALTLTWFVAGVEAANGTSDFVLAPVGIGTKTVQVRASDGFSTTTHFWNVVGTNAEPVITQTLPLQNLTISVAEEVTVAVVAEDADGDALTYSWRLGTTPLPWTGDNATVGPLTEGPHDLVVTVSDGRSSALFVFSVTAWNFAPVIFGANPATDFEMAHTANRLVIISASDQEGDPVSYGWSLGSQTLPGSANSITVGPLPAGVHRLRVVVRDGVSQTERFWNITVTNAPPQFVDVSPPPGAVSVNALTDITFSARAADPDGDVVILSWSVDNDPRNATGALTVQWPLAGSRVVTVDAVSAGHIVSLRWNVTVVQVNTAPTIITSAPSGDELALQVGAEAIFAVTFADDDVLPITISWFVDGDERGSGKGFAFDTTGADVGSHIVRVRVSDGEFAAERTWTVFVSEPSQSTPIGAIGDLLLLIIGLAIGAAAVAALVALRRKRPKGGSPEGETRP